MSNETTVTTLTDPKGRTLADGVQVNKATPHADYRGITVAHLRWEAATVNNRTYGWGRAEVVLARGRGYYVSFSSYSEFTDSARSKLEEAILTNEDVLPLLAEPTREDVSAALTSNATRLGDHAANMNDSIPGRDVREMNELIHAHLGTRAGSNEYYLAEAEGLPSYTDLELAYLRAMQARIAEKIRKLEA